MSTERPVNPSSSNSPPMPGVLCTHGVATRMSVAEYTIEDRFAQALFFAVCQQLGVTVTKTKRRAGFSVRAESATVDRLSARAQELLPQLDARLMDVAENFIREHTGQELVRRER